MKLNFKHDRLFPKHMWQIGLGIRYFKHGGCEVGFIEHACQFYLIMYRIEIAIFYETS